MKKTNVFILVILFIITCIIFSSCKDVYPDGCPFCKSENIEIIETYVNGRVYSCNDCYAKYKIYDDL